MSSNVKVRVHSLALGNALVMEDVAKVITHRLVVSVTVTPYEVVSTRPLSGKLN